MLKLKDLMRFKTRSEQLLALDMQRKALELGIDERLITPALIEEFMELFIEANLETLRVTNMPGGGRVILQRQSE